jgi:hypothetical protein
MIILKFAAVTCAFYITAAFLMEALVFVLARLLGGFMLGGTRTGWAIVFGIIWLTSFLLAWQAVMRPLTSRFSH